MFASLQSKVHHVDTCYISYNEHQLIYNLKIFEPGMARRGVQG